jgi:hypothetical protein
MFRKGSTGTQHPPPPHLPPAHTHRSKLASGVYDKFSNFIFCRFLHNVRKNLELFEDTYSNDLEKNLLVRNGLIVQGYVIQ